MRSNDCRSDRFRSGQFRLGDLRGLREAIFIFGLQRGDNQFGEKLQAAHVAVVEGERLGGKGFQQSNHAPPAAQGHCDHGPRAQLAASIYIYAIVLFGIVAADDLCGTKAGAGKRRVALDARTDIRLDCSRGSA